MAYDTGYSRRSTSERDMQPVSIVSVDPISRTAIGVTRTRHSITINCAFATGDTITTPATGEQWYCERFDNEWRLYGRIPFNDPTLNIKPEEGQVSVGSARGPLELNGPEVRINSKVMRINGVYYRDDGTSLQRSPDQVNWSSITNGDINNLVPLIASALTDYEGDDQDGALLALGEWGGLLQAIIENFSEFWNELCQNVFVGGLKRMGFGDTDLSKTIDGFQNFIDYLFGIVFCDFDGSLTPQTVLARLRDLLAPIIDNSFITGLQDIAQILGVDIGNLLNDSVNGATGLIKLVFDIVTCNWEELAPSLSKIASIIGLSEDSPFGPATIIASLFGTFSFLGDPTKPVGAILAALGALFQRLIDFGLTSLTSTGSLLQDALQGALEFFRILFEVLTCGIDLTDLTGFLAGIGTTVTGLGLPGDVLKFVQSILTPLINNPFLQGLKAFATAMGVNVTGLLDGAIIGATELIKTIFDVLTCQTNLSQLTALIGTATAGSGTPQAILAKIKELLDGLLANPIIAVIQAFVGGTGGLLDQLINGTGDLFNWFLKILKTVLPFDELWTTLLPFIDWVAVDAMEPFDLTGLGLLAGINPLLKIVFNSLETFLGLGTDGIPNFFQNILTFFGDTLSHFFTLLFTDQTEAIRYFLVNILGIASEGIGGVLQFGGTLITATLGAIGDFFANIAAFLGFDFRDYSAVDFVLNLPTFFVLFLDNIKEMLTFWVNSFILGGHGNIAQWAQANITAPIISQFVTGLGIDLTKLGLTPDTLATAPITKLGDIAATLLTNLTKIPANLINGTLPPSVVGSVPVSSISNATPNLITLGSFSESVNVEAADGWVWDSVQTASGSGGSTRVAITSAKNRYLYSRQAVPVVKGDRLVVNATIKTTALTTSGGTTPISVAIIPFVKNSSGVQVAQTAIPIGSAVGSTTNWTAIGNTSVAPYEVTDATWNSVVVRLGVSSTATGGNVWWDDISLKKIGGLIQGNVDSLIAAWNKTIGGLTNAPATTGKTWEDLYGAALAARGQADTGVLYSTNTNTALFNNSAGGSVFYNPGALISSLAGVKADGVYTMSNLLYFLASQLSQNPAVGAGVADVYNAANTTGFAVNTTVPTSATRINNTNNRLFGDQAGGTVLTNLSTLISSLSTIKVDATTSATMANLLAQLASGLSQGTQNAATATAVQTAAIAAGNKAGGAALGLETTNRALFDNPAGGTKIVIGAIPTTAVGKELSTVGSGATLVRTATAVQSVGGQGARVVPASFFNTYTSKSNDINLLSGNTGFQVTLAGWYMVELAYKLNPVASWGWNFTPVLYVNGAAKYGTDVMFTWGGIPISATSGAQRQVQNSFIVNLGVNGTVQAGYDVSLGTYVNDNVLGGGTAAQTYFSISLLNRSYA